MTINKPMKIMLISLGILFGGIFLWKMFQGFMMKRFLSSMGSQTVTVSTTKINYSPWQPQIKAVGSLRAVQGVNVTTSLAGQVQTIYFTPGSMTKKGDVLVQLNADTEIGQLRALEASAILAKITYHRDLAQYKVQAVSKQVVDTDEYNLKNLEGQVFQQTATVAKKTIRAPFSGHLGIRNVNLGQYVNVGDNIVTLQSLDPIYVDFYVPQQQLTQLKVGQVVRLTSENHQGHVYHGKITTINPLIDNTTRNVIVEATFANPNAILAPGMFVEVQVETGKPQPYLTLPQAAVVFNSYGNIVYVVKHKGKDENGKPNLIAEQVFVTTGATRGDQIVILNGLKKGDIVVTSGQVKLKNGSRITINNAVQPANNPDPHVKNDKG
jgi:membrane fusion protein (multidrug efflux system)